MYSGNPFYRTTAGPNSSGGGYYPYGYHQSSQYADPYKQPSTAQLHAARRAQHERELERQRIERARQYLPDEYDIGTGAIPDDYDAYDYGLGRSINPPRPRTTSVPIYASPPSRIPEPQLNQYGQQSSHQPKLYPDDAYPAGAPRRTSRSRSPQRREYSAQTLPSPAPTPPPITRIDSHIHHVEQSLAEIASVETEFQQIQKIFQWPSTIDFDVNGDTVSLPVNGERPDVPFASPAKLAFTTNNKPIHAYNEMLNRFLVKLDAVESWGERSVREKRRAVVTLVETEAANLERVWKRVWEGKDADEEKIEEDEKIEEEEKKEEEEVKADIISEEQGQTDE